jgi:kynurenine formamidase
MDLPSYDQLPRLEPMGLPHAWDCFGAGDQLGSVNLLTPERIIEAARLVQRGVVYNLDLPLNAIDPPMYGRSPMQHDIFTVSRHSRDERLDSFFPQGSTQWDGLRHVRAREFGFWGGVTDETDFVAGAGPLGIEKWVEHGMVGRGVLLDVARHLAERGDFDPFVKRSLTPAELDEVAEAQGVTIEMGDVLCVRTGWMAKYRSQDAEGRKAANDSHAFVGLAADEGMARWIWDKHLGALACDNPAIEVSPGDPAVGSLHRRLLPLLGMAMGELFDLDALAEDCAGDGRYQFMFVSAPLHLVGGVGSTANAVAIR